MVKIIPYSDNVVDIQSSTFNFRCGILQEGDRVLAINGTNVMGYSLAECKQMLHHTGAKCLLEVAFDVAGNKNYGLSDYILMVSLLHLPCVIQSPSTMCKIM